MRISELIKILEEKKKIYGDIKVGGQERIWDDELYELAMRYNKQGKILYL